MIQNQDQIVMAANMIPTINIKDARRRKVANQIMIKTWGGLGDVICSEPIIRYTIENFRNHEIHVATDFPELFRHLKLKDIFNTTREQPIWENYLTFQTIKHDKDISFEFISHMLMHCIDYQSICTFRLQLPIKNKRLILVPNENEKFAAYRYLEEFFETGKPIVVIHAGKHWPTKTFPKDWWDEIITHLKKSKVTPILIGSEYGLDDGRGVVDVETEGCLDLRGKLSVMQSVALLQDCHVLLTNDSAPLHMAASGNSWIGFFATAKHFDLITHWRGENCEFGWRMENLSLGGHWDLVDNCPNKAAGVTADFIEPSILRSWLPEPKTVAQWTNEKIKEML